MPTHISAFDSAFSIIRNPHNVFVIPTFQRPYAWDLKHVHELLDDLSAMHARDPHMHYLSPIHVAKVQRNDDLTIWRQYTNTDNNDIVSLTENRFRDDQNNPLSIYFVIDGQQRLTTLFALYSVFSAQLTISVRGQQIPRLISNSVEDHVFFRNKICRLPEEPPRLQSQKRIDALFSEAYKITREQKAALEDDNLKVLLVEVDANYGLKSFLSLNDRGKSLSVLDKLKSLWMEKDDGVTHLYPLHRAFGDTFQLLDHPGWGAEPFPEDDFVRLLGIRAFWGDDVDCIWRNSTKLFDDYFKPKCNDAANKGTAATLIGDHLRDLDSNIRSLRYLADRLCSNTSRDALSQVVPTRPVQHDYKAFFDAWSPDNRSLAFLARINDAIDDSDWHTPLIEGGNVGERHSRIFDETLERVLSDAKRNNDTQVIPDPLRDWEERLRAEISALRQWQPKRLSALQVVERLDRFVFKTGKNPSATLQAIWQQAPTKDLAERLTALVRLVDSSNYGHYFFRSLLQEANFDVMYRYIICEFESAQDGRWLHGDTLFEFEHIFPLQPRADDPATLNSYGFRDLQDYQRFCGILGNRILVPRQLNRAIGNNWPNEKAGAYAKQRFAETSVNVDDQRRSLINLGETLQSIKNQKFYRLALELRGIDLALFALRRF